MNLSNASCPNCDYKLGRPGTPVPEDNGFHCSDCGHRWKVYGNDITPILSIPPEPNSIEHEPGSASLYVSPSHPKPTFGTGMMIMLSAFITLGLGTGGTVYTLNQLTNDRTGPALKVEQVNFEELVRGASGKVVKVTGTISNTGSTPAPLPGVSIVLRSAGGREVARWRYSSRKTRLAPGEKTHFMSAKPLDYTIVSSVEAQISED